MGVCGALSAVIKHFGGIQNIMRRIFKIKNEFESQLKT